LGCEKTTRTIAHYHPYACVVGQEEHYVITPTAVCVWFQMIAVYTYIYIKETLTYGLMQFKLKKNGLPSEPCINDQVQIPVSNLQHMPAIRFEILVSWYN